MTDRSAAGRRRSFAFGIAMLVVIAVAGGLLLVRGIRIHHARPGVAGEDAIRASMMAGDYAVAESLAWACFRLCAPTTDPEVRARWLDLVVEARWRRGAIGDPRTLRLALEALEWRRRSAHSDPVEVSGSLLNLAILDAKRGAYSAADSLYREVLRLRGKALGPDHPDVAAVLDRLAELRWDLGDHAAARRLHERALDIRERRLGPDHPAVAQSLEAMSAVMADIGEPARARALLERALRIQRRRLGGQHPEVARSLDGLGMVFQDLGERGRARSLLEQARIIRERRLGPAHPDLATSLDHLALVREDSGEDAAAWQLYLRAREIRERALGAGHPALATSLDNLAGVLESGSRFAEARALVERGLAIRERVFGPAHPFVAVSLDHLAGIRRALGDLTAAHSLFVQALDILQSAPHTDPRIQAQTLGNFGALLIEEGNYDEARRSLQQAVSMLEHLGHPDEPGVAAALRNLGLLARRMGDRTGAQSLLERALAIHQRLHHGADPDVSADLNDLGGVLHAAGRLREARRCYERALAMDRRLHGDDDPDVASDLNSLAVLAEDMDDPRGGERLLERALSIRERVLGAFHPAVALTLNNLADSKLAAGDIKDARVDYESALRIRTRALGPEHPLTAWTELGLARAMALGGDSLGALRTALQAEATGREHLRTMTRAFLERQALQYAASRVRGLDLALSVVPGVCAPEIADEIWDSVLRGRSLVLDEKARRQRAPTMRVTATSLLEDSLQQATERYAHLALREAAGERADPGLLDAARAARDRLEQMLADRSTAFSTELTVQRRGLRDVMRALPGGAALVAYVRYEAPGDSRDASGRAGPGAIERSEPRGAEAPRGQPCYAVFVKATEESHGRLLRLGPAAVIDTLVSRWRELAVEPGASSRACEQEGRRLREAVWDPIAPLLRGARRVYLVPDGALNLVSLGTLPDGPGTFLMEHGPLLQYLSSERELLAPPRGSRRARGLVAFGAPSYDAPPGRFAPRRPSAVTEAGRGEGRPDRGSLPDCDGFRSMRFPALAGAGDEARRVALLWARGPGRSGEAATALLGDDASETAFKHEAPTHRVLHVATHAFFLDVRCASPQRARGDEGTLSSPADDALLFAGLALAGANCRDQARSGEEDGVLTAAEIATLDLRGVDWVVLSACNTGLGPIQSGEGVFGLRRAFALAGARAMVMSLWPVNDRETLAWMEALYEARLRHGRDPAEAVRDASLKLLRERRALGAGTQPATWGPFIATGR